MKKRSSSKEKMAEGAHQVTLLIFLVGMLVTGSLLIKGVLFKNHIPSFIGFVVLGWLLRLGNDQWGWIEENGIHALNFLSDIGIIVLLFRIGFESHLKALVEQLSRASLLAISNIVLTAVLTFVVSSYILQLEVIPSLFVATALTATSIGVTVSVWKENQMLNCRAGNLLLDLVALDDVIAIILVGILLQIAPVLYEEREGVVWSKLLFMTLWTVLKLFIFITLCYLFSHFAEKKLIRFLRQYESKADQMVSVASVGFLIASIAAFFGFSVAVGAFFAGISFSQDSKTIRSKAILEPLEDFFIPFFFIGIGFKVSVLFVPGIFGLLVGLLFCAVVGKFLGVYLPAVWTGQKSSSAFLLAVSMIPRAEVTMVSVDQGVRMGEWAVSPELYTVMVMIAVVTSFFVPLFLRPAMKQCA